MTRKFSITLAVLFFYIPILTCQENDFPTPLAKKIFYLDSADLYTKKGIPIDQLIGNKIQGYNRFVLRAIDLIQAMFTDGGGYFIGVKASPPESPIGYNLCFMDYELLQAPRKTSYCSGASYTALVEALNQILKPVKLDSTRLDLLRMQEWNGARREDGVKFWGIWNADGFGSYDALVSYTGMGIRVRPEQALPGDFMNISWKSGIGHSVIFLGWYKNGGKDYVVYWSSQKSTNGLGIDIVSLDKINEFVVVRLFNPGKILTFSPNHTIKKTKGDKPAFFENE